MKQILFITTILLLALTMAYYPGETVNVSNDLNNTNLVYTILYNSTPINLTMNVTNEFITFQIPYDLAPQEFTLVFVPKEIETITETQTVVVHSGGGSSKTKIVEKNNTIYLNDTRYYPIETECNETEEVPEEEKTKDSRFNLLTVIIIFLIMSVVALFIRYFSNRNRKEENEFK